jgi:hypothetical protein
MNTQWTRCLFLLMPFLAACTLQSSPTPPCSLLTTQEVTVALGTTITYANPQTDKSEYTICTYNDPYAPSSKPLVVIQINTHPVTAAALQQSFAAAKVVFEPISGIGDAAFYTGSKDADGTIFVIRNEHSFEIAIIDSQQDQAATRRALQLLAQTALARWSK